jgi:hypothetical protein
MAKQITIIDKCFTDNEIEEILKKYPVLKAQSDIVREQLFGLFPSCVSKSTGMPHASGISNQTMNYGIRNAVNRDYLESKVTTTVGQVRAIEIAFEALSNDCQSLVKLYYYKKKKRYEVQAEICISDDQWKIRRREALDKINEILSITLKPTEKALLLP